MILKENKMIDSKKTDTLGHFVPKANIDNLYNLVIPHSGHTLSDALKDLVDNSFDAGASEIGIILSGENGLDFYTIVDNGFGMNASTLKGALTYSAGSIHDAGDLGKFSIGGTTAACTLGLERKILTKLKGGDLLVGFQDFTNVSKSTIIRKPEPEEEEYFSKTIGECGTIVIIGNLRESKKEYSRIGDLKNALLKDFGRTFYALLNSKRSLTIYTNKGEYKVRPRDPLYQKTDHKKVLFHEVHEVPFENGIVYIRTALLDLEALQVHEKSYEDQGVYFSRNNRLITKGISVKNLWMKNPRKNAGRIEISFTEELDSHFGLTATKNKVSLSQSLTDALRDKVKLFIGELEKKWEKSTDVVSSDIIKENENFANALSHNTGIVGWPKDKNSKQKRDSSNKKKKGSVIPKGTGTTRAGKGVIIPNFKFEEHSKVPEAFWIELESGKMTIIVNLSHAFIREHWTKGTKEQRNLMRKWMSATCLAQFRKKETHHERAAESFMRDMFDELTKIQLALGN